MLTLIIALLGIFGGVYLHIFVMKVNFKQRTIENKIKVYDAIIASWVRMRNHIFSDIDNNKKWFELDQIYGGSQTFIGEIFLITDNIKLAEDINDFNEWFYRAGWHSFDLNEANNKIEELKTNGLQLITRMKNDIKESSTVNLNDLVHFFTWHKK